MEAFAAADLDTDGLLDREEARKLAQSLGVSDDADLPLAIAGMGDRISQSEFVEWYKSQHSSNIQNLAKTLSPTHLLAGAKEVVSIEEMDDRDVRKLAVLAAQKQKQKVSKLSWHIIISSCRDLSNDIVHGNTFDSLRSVRTSATSWPSWVVLWSVLRHQRANYHRRCCILLLRLRVAYKDDHCRPYDNNDHGAVDALLGYST